MTALLLVLLAQASAPGAPPSTEPGSQTREPAPSLVRPEDFTLADPGGGCAAGRRCPATSPSPPRPRAAPRARRRTSGFDFIPIPVASFNSDTGFGLGVVLLAYVYGKDYRPYRHGLTAQFFATTTGFQGHYITWDAPHLLGPVRVEARLEFHKDLVRAVLRPGNHTFPGQSLEGPDKFFGYQNVWTSDWLRFRIKPLGDQAPLTRLRGLPVPLLLDHPVCGLEPRPGAPTSTAGPGTVAAVAGILFDTRDDEQNTHSGFLVQVGRTDGAALDREPVQLPGRHLRHPHLLLALDPAGSYSRCTPRRTTSGETFRSGNGTSSVASPAWRDWVGWTRSAACPGTARGNTKALGNVELRATVEIPSGPGRRCRLACPGLLRHRPGVAAGPGKRQVLRSSNQWHSGVGGGLRLMRRAAVIRADFGFDLDTKRTGIYVAFGQLF